MEASLICYLLEALVGRKNRVFKSKSNSAMEVVESITWSVSEWATMQKEFL